MGLSVVRAAPKRHRGVDIIPGNAFGILVANEAAGKNTVCKYTRFLISGFFVAKRCFREASQPHFQQVSQARACVYVCITCKEYCKKELICKKHLKVGFINREID